MEQMFPLSNRKERWRFKISINSLFIYPDYMIATNIPLFQWINQLPIILDPIILDEGGDIEETLRRNNAKYHQNCRLLFNNTMLERIRKTAACSNISSDDGKSKIRRTNIKGHMCFYARKKIQHLNFGKPWQSSLING